MSRPLPIRPAARGTAFCAALLALTLPDTAWACPACLGTTDSALQAGMNLGVLTLAGFTGAMLAGVGLFVLRLARRARYATPGGVR